MSSDSEDYNTSGLSDADLLIDEMRYSKSEVEKKMLRRLVETHLGLEKTGEIA
jgi:hypothetical protein